MKLASLSHGRDGRLVVVSGDLTRATDAFPVVATLQAALDDWTRYGPRLADLAEGLEHGSVPSFRFHEHDCASPLPRAYQRLTAGGPGSVPNLVQAVSDSSVGPRSPIQAASEEDGIAVEAGIAVITGDVPMGVSAEAALGCVRLVMLASTAILAALRSDGGTGESGAPVRLPATFSPVAVTPDELGPAWQGGRLGLSLLVQLNGKALGRLDAGAGMAVGFGSLIALAARTRPLTAGSIIGSGALASPMAAATPSLRFGDSVRIEMKDAAGHSIFGAIEQEILPHAL